MHERFEALLGHLASIGTPTGDPLERAAAAMVLLGPDRSLTEELAATWTSFTSLYEELVSSSEGIAQGLNVLDFMVAFGCGWGRSVTRGPEWAGAWELAVFALLGQVRASVMETSRLLEGNGPRYRLTVDERAQFPGFFTMALVRGCSCGHHRRGCGGACGRGCCFEDHDLAAWDPSACGLRPFIDQAVRGRPGRKIFGGAF